MSGNTSEETFEFIETPAASSTVSEFDCGVKTTSVRSISTLARTFGKPLSVELQSN
jgi:hypothetical protein